jgi:hypothetical protein
MVSLAEAAQAPGYPAEIALVISNIPTSPGSSGRDFGIATATVDHRSFGKDREAFERAVDEVLRSTRSSCRARRLHAHPDALVRGALGRPDDQHPPVAAAAVQGHAYASAGAGSRRWNMAARCISSCRSSMPGR